MANFIPEHLFHHSMAYSKMKELGETFYNDQELGREIRKYLNDIK